MAPIPEIRSSDIQQISILENVSIVIVTLICIVGLFLIVSVCAWCCDKVEEVTRLKKPTGSPSTSDKESKRVVVPAPIRLSYVRTEQVTTAFALNWFRALDSKIPNDPPQSLISSPFAVQTACALWYLGLNQKLQEQIVEALFPGCKAATEDVIMVLKTMSTATKWWRRRSLRVANRLYVPSTCRYSPIYRAEISFLLGGQSVLQVDFVNNAGALIDSMNRWVAAVTKGQTRHLIHSLIDHNETEILLISAISVDGHINIENQFDRYCTRYGEAFHVSADRKTPVDYMWQHYVTDYFEDDRVQVVRIPYKGGDVGMSLYCFLPRKRYALAEFEASLTPEYFSNLITLCHAASKPVEIFLPKIKLSSELKGMKFMDAMTRLSPLTAEVFKRPTEKTDDQESNFAKMVRIPKHKKKPKQRSEQRARNARLLWIAQAAHKTDFELTDVIHDTDSTTTYSAACNLSLRRSQIGANNVKEPAFPIFNADHPFLFVLTMDAPRIPIVMGRFCGN